MKLAIKTVATLAAAVILVGVAAFPANAVDATGGLSCSGPTYPTVQYKNNGPTEVRWQDAPNGNFLQSPSQYPANYPVYDQSPRQSPTSYYAASYASGSTFEYGVNGFCG